MRGRDISTAFVLAALGALLAGCATPSPPLQITTAIAPQAEVLWQFDTGG